MKLAALFSGGKDSTYALYLAKNEHEIKYLATIHSKNPASYMWHTANIGLTVIQAGTMGMKLVSKESTGRKEQEIHDLKVLLKGLEVDGLVCGVIASNYQKRHILSVCRDLKLELLSPLWGREPEELLKEMLKKKFEIIISAVAADGFNRRWLGRKINKNCIKDLLKLKKKHKINMSGEGGEFETTVLDCPLFKKKIEVTKFKKKWKRHAGIFEIKDVKLLKK